MKKRDQNPQGRMDSFKPTCIVVVVLTLVILTGVVIWMYNTIKYGWDQARKNLSESSSLPDPPSDVSQSVAREEAHVPPLWS